MRNKIVYLVLISILQAGNQAFGNSESYSAITSSRNGVVIPTWLIIPDKPHTSVVIFAGGDGNLGISEDGIEKTSNFLVRTRDLFANAGFVVAIVDVPSDRNSLRDFRSGKKHAKDIKAVIAYLRQQHNLPVWLIGTSRGAISATNGAAHLTQGGPDGIVLAATVNQASNSGADSVHSTKLKKITQPVLLVHHKNDECYVSRYKGMKKVMKKLKNASRIELLSYEGGENTSANPCKANTYHGFLGIESRVVDDIARWILKQ